MFVTAQAKELKLTLKCMEKSKKREYHKEQLSTTKRCAKTKDVYFTRSKMKKAKDILKKIAFAIFAVLLYMVYVADRLLTSPFPIEQPKPVDWKTDKIKYSIIRVFVVALLAWLFHISWILALIVIFALVIAIVIAEWRRVKNIAKS